MNGRKFECSVLIPFRTLLVQRTSSEIFQDFSFVVCLEWVFSSKTSVVNSFVLREPTLLACTGSPSITRTSFGRDLSAIISLRHRVALKNGPEKSMTQESCSRISEKQWFIIQRHVQFLWINTAILQRKYFDNIS